MEKIYIENFNNKKSNKNIKTIGVLLTSMLMVVVAIAAFVASGFNNVSYALPDEFDTVEPEVRIISNTGFTVSPYYTSEGAQVYCIDNRIDFIGNAHYQNGGKIDDYGLMYLIANGYPTKSVLKGKTTGDQVKDNYASTWVMQVAIWMYQYIVNDVPISNGESLINPDATVDTLRVDTGSGSAEDAITISIAGVDFRTLAYGLALEAQNNSNPNNLFKVEATGSSKEDGDYFVSGPVKINANGSLKNYTIKITSNIKDAQIIDGNGKAISSTDELTADTKEVYVKVPKSSLSEGETSVNLIANAVFNSLGAYKYAGTYDDNGTSKVAQPLADVYPTTAELSSTATVKFKVEVDVPDTGMTTAQTIYFIGLVVLLCGVGIVYANVKPKEAE